jgi:hypothetical protein
MKIAGRIRYAYLTEEQAQAKGLDIEKYHKLKKILTKLEDVFYSGGGKKENLKKAILTGKGNKDHEVSGLGMVADTTFYDENTPLNVLLSGIEEEEMQGLNGLGFVTSAAVAAASSAMAIIAGLIKQIGGIKKGGKDAPSGEEGSSSENVDTSDAGGDSGDSGSGGSSNKMMMKKSSSGSSDTSTDDSGGGSGSGGGGFLEKTKTWVKEHPMQAGAVAIGVTALGVLAVKHFTKKKEKPKGLSGVYHKKHKKKKGKAKHTHHKHHKHHKAPIALL